MNIFLKSRYDYLIFRRAWKKATKHEKAKTHTTTVTHSYSDGETRIETVARPPWVTSAHLLLFNIVLGKPVLTGFCPITNQAKLDEGIHQFGGFEEALMELRRILSYLERNKEKKNRWMQKRIEWFLEPFAGTCVTADTLELLNLTNACILTSVAKEKDTMLQEWEKTKYTQHTNVFK